MPATAAVPIRDVVCNTELGPEYFRRVRVEVLSRRNASAELEGLLNESLEPLQEATVRDLLGDRKSAVEMLTRRKSDPIAQALAGEMLLEQGRIAEALDLLEKGRKEHPSSVEIGIQLVEARAASGNTEGASSLLEKLKLDQDQARASFLRGYIAERNGEYKEALARYEEASIAQPEETRFQFRLAFLNSLYGDDELALQGYEMCQRSAPVFANALINLGVMYEDLDRYEEAMTCYRMVLEANPKHERARLYAKDAQASLDMYYDREIEKERSRRNQLLQLPVTDFELSVRSRNCLAKMNIHTLGDLIQKSETELLSYKNFGETSLSEIKRILVQKGLRLGMGLDDGRKDSPELPDSEQSKLLQEPVSVLELSSRSQRCMDKLGIESLADLVSRTELELVSQKNFGVTSLNEVKKKLKERGLSLAGG